MENRLKSYKSSSRNVNHICSRQNCVKNEERKSKKDDQLDERRNIDLSLPLEEPSLPPIFLNTTPLEEIITHMQGSESVLVHYATQAARKMLMQRDPPINDMISNGIVQIFVDFLNSESSDLQYEAAWALKMITSGTQSQINAVAKAGAIPKFISLMKLRHVGLSIQSSWALNNILDSGSYTHKSEALENNIVEVLVEISQKEQQLSLLRTIVWLTSTLCYGKYLTLPVDKVKIILPVLAELLCHDDFEIVSDAAWAIGCVGDWLYIYFYKSFISLI
ncbi:importin subunit alpha-like [Contarinia nasturtii]|uniref:importin subunit alpha-like n=1 Tax=Contarinia nasturtii TaxID=265458 RepID=UPI0012D482A3|nr:importin subunit alpha-like [Contarinia nasturtii]